MTTEDTTKTKLPANWACWSEEERDAYRNVEEAYDAVHEAREALEAALPQPLPKQLWSLVDTLEVSAKAMQYPAVDLIRNRLKRYRPDLSDLIDFATSNPAVYQSDLPHGDCL